MRNFIVFIFFIGLSINSIAQSWEQVGIGNNALNANAFINTIAIDHNNNIYVGGGFTDGLASYNGKNYVAKWNGTSWSKLGGLTVNNTINTIVTDKNGNVYVAGKFNNIYSSTVVKWDGNTWTYLEAGSLNKDSGLGYINALAVDDNYVYAGGQFLNTNGGRYVGKWDGTRWNEIGTTGNTFGGFINAITIDKNGNLYAAGNFFKYTSDTYYMSVAKWDGTSWSRLGDGIKVYTNYLPSISTLATDEYGNVYVGGSFYNDVNKNYIAKWNGNNWSELAGSSDIINGNTNSIVIDKDNNIFAAGNFSINGRQYVVKWDGNTWSKLQSNNIFSQIYSMVISESNDIYVTGESRFVAKWTSNLSTDMNNSTNKNLVKIFPNPSNDQIHVDISEEGNINFYNVLGQLVLTKSISEQNNNIDISRLSNGIYSLIFNGNNNTYYTEKFIKE